MTVQAQLPLTNPVLAKNKNPKRCGPHSWWKHSRTSPRRVGRQTALGRTGEAEVRFPSRGRDLREAEALPQVLPGPRVTATGPPHALLPRPPAQAGCGPRALGPTRRVPRSPAAGPTRGSGTRRRPRPAGERLLPPGLPRCRPPGPAHLSLE